MSVQRSGVTPLGGQAAGVDRTAVAAIATVPELAGLLRWLRRRDARRRDSSEVTYRELASRTGWSHAAVGEYFTGRALPPTDRFDELVRLLGASPAEAGMFGTARDRVEERRRKAPPLGTANGTGGARPVPGQLPADVAGFTGRADHIAALNTLLDAEESGSVVVIAAVSGTAGIGKTALAVHWAHQVRHRFPDGQLYVNLRGFDPGGSVMDPAEAVRGFLDALDVAPPRIPAGLDAQAALYRSVVAGRRMLIVADNARDADQVRPLLPGAPGCLVVITSRNQLPSLVAATGAHPLMLDLLTPVEARDFLSRRLGSARLAAEPRATGEIIARCARLPLALAIVAARAASHPQFPLAVLAGELRDARALLDALSSGDAVADLRAVFSWSYQALDPDAARVFRLLSLHPGPDISAPAAASLTGLTVVEARWLLVSLARAHLVTEHIPGRYGFHDLLRAYAAEQASATDADQERHAALHRMLDHYLHSASAADRRLDPHRDSIALITSDAGVSPESPADHGRVDGWFAAEHPVLVSAVELAADARFDTHAWQLAWAIATYLRREGHWHDWYTTQAAGLAAAERLNDPLGRAVAHRGLARVDIRTGRLDDARGHLQRALELYEELCDGTGQAHIHTNLGVLASREGRYRDALGHNQLALDMFRAADHRVGQSVASNNIGWIHANLGNHQQALDSCRQALALQQELGDRDSEASTWDSLGFAEHNLGHYDRAVECYDHAVRLFREIGDRYNEAEILVRLGDAHHATGQVEHARAAWEQAVEILNHFDHPDTDQIRERLRRLRRPT